MSEMVERVAKTLHEIDLTVGTPNYYQVAAAVIEAMREPSDRMLRVPHSSLFAWKSMIDAALDR